MTSQIITQLRSHCQCSGIKYCPLAPLMHLPERVLVQHKCVEAFKWERSQIVGTDIGWRKAYELWAEEGFAARFADLYHDGISAEEIMAAIKKEVGTDLRAVRPDKSQGEK
jgi:hypothetical protein